MILPRCIQRTLLLSCWLLAALAQAELPVEYAFDSSVNSDMLETKIAEAESNTELTADTRKSLIEHYRRAITNLEAYASNTAAIERYASSIDSVADELERLQGQLDALNSDPGLPVPTFDKTASRSDIGREYLKALAHKTSLEAEVSRLFQQREAEQQRFTLSRQMLADAISRQTQGAASSSTVSLVDDPLQLRIARQWLRETSNLRLSSEITRLDQELLSYASRIYIKRLRSELAKTRLQHSRARTKAIEAVWLKKRRENAHQIVQLGKINQQAFAQSHPLLKQAANDNLKIAQRIDQYVDTLNILLGKTVAAEEAAFVLDQKFRNVRQKLQVAGVNKALGRLLQDARQDLPSQKDLQSDLTQRREELADITMQQLMVDEDLLEMQDLPEYIEQLLGTLSPKALGERHELVSGLEQLLRQRLRFYTLFSQESSAYQQLLSDFEAAQLRLLDIVQEYDALLAQRSLWVRSDANPLLETVDRLTDEKRPYIVPAELKSILLSHQEAGLYAPVLMLGLLLSLVLLLAKPKLHRALSRCNRDLENPETDHFRCTLVALLVTVLLALPGPLLLASFGWQHYFHIYDSGLAKSIGPAMRWAAMNWFIIAFSYQLCRPGGLAHHHFGWPETALGPLHRKIAILLLTFVPLGFVNVCLTTLDASGAALELLRAGQVAEILVFAVFFLSVLRDSGSLMQTLKGGSKQLILLRFRWLWLALSVVMPLSLVLLITLGYMHTAVTLMDNVVRSAGLVLVLAVCHQLGMRWLRVTAFKLDRQEKQKKQAEREAQARDRHEQYIESDQYHAPAVDLAMLRRDSIQLLNTIITIAAVIGFIAVWFEALPALGYLENIRLWSSTTTLNGEVALRPITLADLSLCLLLVIAAFLLYRNLPSLMKLLFLQMPFLSDSVRFTTINLTLYTIIIITLFSVASMLGFEWSKFQWLAAALGVGIGFGLQEIVANFISGLIILFERPIRIGDLVTVGEVEGIVSRIRIRATTIQTYDRQELLVPNKAFITGNLLNWSLSDPISRLIVDVGVAYGSDVTRASQIMAEAARSDEMVIGDPAPVVIFESFGDSALNLRLQCFIDQVGARVATRSRLHHAINRRLTESGIEMAFPQLDVHFDQDRPINIKQQGA